MQTQSLDSLVNSDLDVLSMALVNQHGRIETSGISSSNEQIEAQKMHDRMQDFYGSDFGKGFMGYATRTLGLEQMTIEGYGATNLGDPGAVAALMHNGKQGVIVANYIEGAPTYEDKAFAMAQQFGVSVNDMEEYVIVHELAHSLIPSNPIFATEQGADGFTGKWYATRAAQQRKLADKAKTQNQRDEYMSEAKRCEKLAGVAKHRVEQHIQVEGDRRHEIPGEDTLEGVVSNAPAIGAPTNQSSSSVYEVGVALVVSPEYGLVMVPVIYEVESANSTSSSSNDLYEATPLNSFGPLKVYEA